MQTIVKFICQIASKVSSNMSNTGRPEADSRRQCVVSCILIQIAIEATSDMSNHTVRPEAKGRRGILASGILIYVDSE